LTEIIAAPTRTKTIKEQLSLLSQTIEKMREDRKQQVNHLSRSLINQSERSITSDEHDQ
jgi:hypothetical protein